MVLSTSHDADTKAVVLHETNASANVMPVWMSMTSHDIKGHVVPHFQLTWPKEFNGAILMQLALCDINTSAKCGTLFWLSYLKNCSSAIDDTIGLTWC